MGAELYALAWKAEDPRRLAAFWAGVLGWSRDGTDVVPGDGTGFRLRFVAAGPRRSARNRMHFDLTSTSYDQQTETVARALALGGSHLDVGQLPEEEHVVLADPEGNELCVIEPGNAFLAECGFVGALASDGSREVGVFWSEALGWPLVWDRDGETAIRSPRGGPKITWGGPPVTPQDGEHRLGFELLPDGDAAAEVARLVSLGATPLRDDAGAVVLADPDGNELRVLAGAVRRQAVRR